MGQIKRTKIKKQIQEEQGKTESMRVALQNRVSLD
jgi:hypothetical protein